MVVKAVALMTELMYSLEAVVSGLMIASLSSPLTLLSAPNLQAEMASTTYCALASVVIT